MLFFIFLCLYSVGIFSQSEPGLPLKIFDNFFPASKLEALEKLYGKGEEGKSPNEGVVQRKYTLRGSTILIQVKNGQVIDFYARFPTPLSHDAIHRSLIDRYGKQDSYFNINGSAVYVWENENNNSITYSGQCTLTCFPHYLSVTPKEKPKSMPTFKSFIQFFMENEF